MRDEQPGADALRFNQLWDAHAGQVRAYAARHVGHDDAQEVVAETFLVAWRRLADVPGHPLPWLLVVARNTVANHRRSSYRGAVVHGELARLHQAAEVGTDAGVTALQRAQALARLAALSPKDREALLLVSWDGLDSAEAAQVAGCSPAAFHVRLHRARRRLVAAEVSPEEGAPVHRSTTSTATSRPPLSSTRSSLTTTRTAR